MEGKSMIGIDFFKATATVIPTLLIAASLTAKPLQREPQKEGLSEKDLELSEWQYGNNLKLVTTVVAITFLGEGASLAALISGDTRIVFAVVTLLAIFVILSLLGVLIISEEAGRLKNKELGYRLTYILILAALVSVGIVVYGILS